MFAAMKSPANSRRSTKRIEFFREPKLRIQHLLQLEGKKNSTNDRSVPSDLQELFLQIGTLCQKTQRVLAISDGSTALARSLAKTNLLQAQRQTGQLLEQLSRSYDACLAELRSLNEIWNNEQEEAAASLATITRSHGLSISLDRTAERNGVAVYVARLTSNLFI